MGDMDEEPPRIGAEVYRQHGFVVRLGWEPHALEVEGRIGGQALIIQLDPFEARDMVRELTAWQSRLEVSGLAPIVGPAERG